MNATVSKGEFPTIESCLYQSDYGPRVDDVFDGAFGVFVAGLPPPWIKHWNNGMKGFSYFIWD